MNNKKSCYIPKTSVCQIVVTWSLTNSIFFFGVGKHCKVILWREYCRNAGETVQCFHLTLVLITRIDCLFTWIHNDYCVPRKNSEILEAYWKQKNLFGTKYYIFSKKEYLYTFWQLVWRFTCITTLYVSNKLIQLK